MTMWMMSSRKGSNKGSAGRRSDEQRGGRDSEQDAAQHSQWARRGRGGAPIRCCGQSRVGVDENGQRKRR